MKLAQASGNSILKHAIHELVTRSSLIVGLFGASNHKVCPEDKHSNILSAVEQGDSDAAEVQMFERLNRMRDRLNFAAPKPQEVTWRRFPV